MVNITETKVMVFRLGGYITRHEKWYLGGEEIETVNEYKYLGNMFTPKLCVRSTQSDLAGRARAALMPVTGSLKRLACDARYILQAL